MRKSSRVRIDCSDVFKSEQLRQEIIGNNVKIQWRNKNQDYTKIVDAIRNKKLMLKDEMFVRVEDAEYRKINSGHTPYHSDPKLK